MNILVTGGAGYIGSHACKLLSAKGYQPITYDNLSRGHRAAVKWGPLEVGDIADRDRLRAVLVRYRPAALMHFAAFAYVGEFGRKSSPALPQQRRRKYLAAKNGQPIWSVAHSILIVMRDLWHPLQVSPFPKDHPQQPINPYGHSKLFVERILADLERASALPWVSLRYFNAAGCGSGWRNRRGA